jgi:hypothetical protein
VKEREPETRMLRLELKYCECCGGLLLRRTGEGVVYCGPCARRMSDLPEAKPVGKGTRKARVGCVKAQGLGQMGRTLPCAEECGNAESFGLKIGPKPAGIEAMAEGRLA